jgi:phage-related protein (TIGR01555 family)
MPTRMDDVDALARISGGSGAEIVARMYQNYTRGTQQLDRASIQYFYRRYGILKKLVNVPANQMTYRWGYLQLGGKRGDAKIRDAFEAFTDQLPVETLYNHRLGLRTAFGLAQKAANKMGNGAILMDLDDGEDLDRPINFNKLKGIRRLYVLDRWSLKPLIIGSTRDHDFYQLGGVAFSRFLTDVRRGAAVQAVHKSRVLWFRGEELDDNELMRTGGCDDSVFESTISSFLDYRASICGAKQMIQDFDIFVHELEGLLTELETDGNQEYETLIRERIEINDRMRRLHRTMLVDKDKERIGHSSRQVSGYSDLMDRVLNDFLANVELTPAELLGKYPEGMADTGQTEQQNANDRTSRYQEEKFRSNIVAFCKVLFRCKEFVTQGKIPDTWKFVFELLYPVTPPEQAELQLNYAQIDDINIRNGVYSGDDVARSRYGSADFQPNIIIDFKKREAAQKAAQEGEAPPEGEGAPEDDIEALLANYQTDSADPVRLLPPPEVRQAVQQALKFAREKGIKIPATLQTLTLNLSMGVPLREEEVRSMNLFFLQSKNRKVAKQPPEEGYGAILWLAMGGDIGERWSGAIERELGRRVDGVRLDKPCGEGFIADRLKCNVSGVETRALTAAAALGAGALAYTITKDMPPEIRAFSVLSAVAVVGVGGIAVQNAQRKRRSQEPEPIQDLQHDEFGRPQFPQNPQSWTPSMTQQSADEWSKNSFFPETFYHGTRSQESVREIQLRGFSLDVASRVELGDGIYLAKDKAEALHYTRNDKNKKSDSRVLQVKTNLQKPLLLGAKEKYHFPEQAIKGMGYQDLYFRYEEAHHATAKARMSTMKAEGVSQKEIQQFKRQEQERSSSRAMRDTLKALGFDGVYTSNNHWLIVFDKTSLTTIAKNTKTDAEPLQIEGVRADVVTVSDRTDDDTPIKRAIHWKEYQIGLQYEALDERHGRILPLAYGEFLGLPSDHDGMNADVYVGPELGSDRVFAVTQLDYDTGEFDEVKFIIGVHKPIDEVAKLYQAIMTPQHFGGIVEITKEEIPTYKPQTYLSRKGDAAKPEHIAMGVGAAAAIGAGAFLLNKTVEHRQREGQKCGESYISANYQCRIGEQGGQVSPQAEKVIALVSAQNREIIEFATNPKIVPLLEEEVDFAKDILSFAKKANDSVSPGSFDAKVLKIQKLTGATEVEAAALSGYLGPIYKQMNEYFHSRVSTGDEASRKLGRMIAAPSDDMITVNKAAINALKKIESVTESRIQKEIRTTFKGKSVGWNDLGNEFYHHARIKSPEIFSQIDQGYNALKKENKTFPLEKFLSTTMHQAGLIGFKEKSNLEIKIKPRLDGKGGGKLVDRFKNSLIEYEILYVPGTQFKVKEVRNQLIRTVKKKNGSKDEIRYLTIELEEV